MSRSNSETNKREGAERTSRRAFLKLAAAAPAVAVATAGGAASAAVEEEQPTALGLRKTEHVRKYLESCRF